MVAVFVKGFIGFYAYPVSALALVWLQPQVIACTDLNPSIRYKKLWFLTGLLWHNVSNKFESNKTCWTPLTLR